MTRKQLLTDDLIGILIGSVAAWIILPDPSKSPPPFACYVAGVLLGWFMCRFVVKEQNDRT